VVGSLLLGLWRAGAAAIVTAAVVYWTAPSQRGLRERIRFVNRSFAGSAQFDRGFVRWKMRLDRIFSLLGLRGSGIGDGGGPGLRLRHGAHLCGLRRPRDADLSAAILNAHRIAVAQQALRAFNAEASVQDVRDFALPPAGLILILDVLQYLPGEEQLALLKPLLRRAGTRRPADLPGA